MRTTTFKKILDKVLIWHGINPRKDISPDLARAVVEHINERVRTIALVWDWPEWRVTEQRAFRPIWNADRQFLRVGDDGKRDEVFYLEDELYYGVIDDESAVADPPIGTLPTDTDYWEQIEVIDPYIAYSQTCRREIGTVLGIYSDNPRNHVLGGCGANGVRFSPSEKGIDVRGSSGPTVYITYMMPIPQYTIVPYVENKVYLRGVTVFDTTTDECFQSLLTTNTEPPSNPAAWKRVPFLTAWEQYVTRGAFADSMCERDQAGDSDIQSRIILMQAAEQKANDALQLEIDSLQAQGQTLRWSFNKHCNNWCESQPWSGGDVVDIDSACEDDLGWVYPTVSTQAGVVWKYEWQVNTLRTPEDPVGTEVTLDALNTRLWLPGSRINVVIGPSGSRVASEWLLVAGVYDPDDPGQIQPSDYNATNNNKHWEQIQ